MEACSYQIMIKRLGKPDFDGRDSLSTYDGEQESAFGVLKPKGPEPQIAKEFRLFLSQLATLQRISVPELMRQGYSLKFHGQLCVPQFPNSDKRRLFDEMRRSGKHLSALLKPSRANQMSRDNISYRPTLSCP